MTDDQEHGIIRSMRKDTIWTITAVALLENRECLFRRFNPKAVAFEKACIGFDHDREKAMEWLARSYPVYGLSGPTPEIRYAYAVVEEYDAGILLTPEAEEWFRAENGKWVPCDKPEGVANICSFFM